MRRHLANFAALAVATVALAACGAAASPSAVLAPSPVGSPAPAASAMIVPGSAASPSAGASFPIMGSGVPASGVPGSACADASALGSSLQALLSIDLQQATKDQFVQAWDKVVADWNTFRTDVAGAAAADKQRVQTAYDNLKAAIEALPSGTTARDAVAAVRPQLVSFGVALRQTVTDLGCG